MLEQAVGIEYNKFEYIKIFKIKQKYKVRFRVIV